jgi:hypothetical protein
MTISNKGTDYEKPERFEWLLAALEKQFETFKHDFDSLNQKATWVLATATAFATASGFIKGTSIGVSARATIGTVIEWFQGGTPIQFSPDMLITLVALAFGVLYVLLLIWVVKVYQPKPFEYPISPINTDLEPAVSRYQDEGKYGEKMWEDLIDRYILPDDMTCYHRVLRGYVDGLIETYLTINQMGENLGKAFKCLYPLSVLSIILLFLA